MWGSSVRCVQGSKKSSSWSSGKGGDGGSRPVVDVGVSLSCTGYDQGIGGLGE